jgi:hypothetical protein
LGWKCYIIAVLIAEMGIIAKALARIWNNIARQSCLEQCTYKNYNLKLGGNFLALVPMKGSRREGY